MKEWQESLEKLYKPILLGGFGELGEFGKQYRQGNRIYSSNAIAMALTAQPLGNTGGYSYLYVVGIKHEQNKN